MSGGGGSIVNTGILCVGKLQKFFFHIVVYIQDIFSHQAINPLSDGMSGIYIHKNEKKSDPYIENL